MRRFIIICISLLVLTGAAIAGGYYWLYHGYWYKPSDSVPQAEKELVIEKGSSSLAIIASLEQAGVIHSPLLFRIAATLEGEAAEYKAGEYRFSTAMTPQEISAQLMKGANVVRSVTIVEGWLSEQVVAALNQEPRFTGTIAVTPPEGSILPETYFFSTGDSRQKIIDMMQHKMNEVLDNAWDNRSEGLPIANKKEMLVLASIVEKETGSNSEQRHVASVFINRLKRGMKLQSDPTANYGQYLLSGELKTRMLIKDVQHESAYNTYVIDGLPPEPICNPGAISIEAVAYPLNTNDIYFVADGEGGHVFAQTLQQHNQNVAAYRAKMRESN
jgi:UPF0755 protein